ncbi:unnamed protein product [Laminaria digitata]
MTRRYLANCGNCWNLPPRISTRQLTRRRRHLERALRQKHHRPEMTRAHYCPTRLRQECNLKVANKDELLTRGHGQMAQLHPSHTKD